MKKWIFAIFVLGLILSFSDFVFALEKNEVNFFYSQTCPHCAKESQFLDELKDKYPQVEIKRFEISKKANVDLLLDFYQEYQVPSQLYGQIPATFIEARYFVGFNEEIQEEIESCVLGIVENSSQDQCQCEECSEKREDEVNLPIIGKINISKYSLPFLAVVLGALDGFNVCSLGALILILGLVLALKSRKQILIFGAFFILTTASVYGFLIVLWYQIFSFFMPYLKIMEILIGFLAIAGAIYFLSQFFKYRNQGPTCEVGAGKKIISKFSSNFQNSLQGSGNVFLLIGSVILFAVVITIVEFPCSAAVPVVFAGTLAKAGLSTFSYLFYISLFLLFYMLDELIVFLIAFFTMTLWLSSSKVLTWIILVEAVILFLLGLYYLFGFGL